MGGSASKRKGSAEVSPEVYIPSGEKTKRGGKSAKAKGYRNEVKTVKYLQSCGCWAQRGDGTAGRDVYWRIRDNDAMRKAESKARAGGKGFTTIERWLGSNDILVCWRDGQDPLIVMSAATFRGLVKEGK